MTLVDSHCHLDDERFAEDLDTVLERATAAGVSRILTIGTGDGPPEIDRAVRLAERYEQVYASVGVHPQDASKFTPRTLDDLRALVTHQKVVAFGEIGLDYHWEFSPGSAPREAQREVFVEQLKLARAASLPITIHTRDAWDDTMVILREHWRREESGDAVMHCFTGGPAQAQEALDLGFYLSFGGVLTFKTADQVRESARITPGDKLLVETDAPYLAPMPYRGKRNEPAMMIETARKLAAVRETTVEEIASITTANFERVCFSARLPR
jgi:TatD DNase family protein